MCLRWIVWRVVSRPPAGWATKGRRPAMVMRRRSCEDHVVLGGHPSTFCFGHKALARNECLRVPCAGHLARPARTVQVPQRRWRSCLGQSERAAAQGRAARRRWGCAEPASMPEPWFEGAFRRGDVLPRKQAPKAPKAFQERLSCRVARACTWAGRGRPAGALSGWLRRRAAPCARILAPWPQPPISRVPRS